MSYCRIDERRRHVHRLQRRTAMHGASGVVTRQVPRDFEDPGALAAVASVLGTERAQEDVLRQVLRGRSVADEPPEKPVHRQAVLCEQGFYEQALHEVSCCW
jgi:hypothetical protein